MPAPLAIKVSGLREAIAAAKTLDAKLPKELVRIARDAAKLVVPIAQSLVPRQSGALGSTIRVGATARSAVVKVGTPAVPYAGPIHWGWPRRNIEPQPFLVDALALAQPEIVEQYARDLESFIERTWR